MPKSTFEAPLYDWMSCKDNRCLSVKLCQGYDFTDPDKRVEIFVKKEIYLVCFYSVSLLSQLTSKSSSMSLCKCLPSNPHIEHSWSYMKRCHEILVWNHKHQCKIARMICTLTVRVKLTTKLIQILYWFWFIDCITLWVRRMESASCLQSPLQLCVNCLLVFLSVV